MATLDFPVVWWPLGEESFCASVVGSGLTVVGSGWKDLAGQIKGEMTRRIRERLEVPALEHPQFRIEKVWVRPEYVEPLVGVFPFPFSVEFPVPCVFGPTGYGGQTCYLPLLKGQFTYFDQAHFLPLLKHTVQTLFRDVGPEETFRLLWSDPPTFEIVRVPAPPRPRRGGILNRMEEDYPRAFRVADPVPPPRSVRKQLRAGPIRCWERGVALREIEAFLLQDTGSLLLIGEEGIGKSTVLEAAVKAANRRSEDHRSRLIVFRTTPHRMIAQARFFGEWQEIVEDLVEAELRDPSHVLWIEDFVSLLTIGGNGPEDSLGAFLWSLMRGGSLRIVGEITPKELDVARSLLPGFMDSFETRSLEVLDREAVFRLLRNYQADVLRRLRIHIDREAMGEAFRLPNRFLKHQASPGRETSFLGSCINEAAQEGLDEIGRDEVIDAFVRHTGLPEIILRDDVQLGIDDVLRIFRGDVLGQEAALEDVARVVLTYKAGLNDPDRPVATMLFSGPTGVGKTATARAISDFFFGAGQKKEPLIRLDMSEFQDASQIARLVGSGDDPGVLVSGVREKPFSLVLLDEIEKAHPVFFDALLTVLDEGILYDALGRATDFRNSIIVMTTNLGSQSMGSLGFVPGDEAARRDTAIRDFFRPEFFNRIDKVVHFEPLGAETIANILQKELKALERRGGLEQRKLTLDYTETFLSWLADVGFDERYGARPLQRAVEQHVVAPVARYLLTQPHLESATLTLDLVDGAPLVGTR